MYTTDVACTVAFADAADGQQPEAVNKKAITIIHRVREKLTGTLRMVHIALNILFVLRVVCFM